MTTHWIHPKENDAHCGMRGAPMNLSENLNFVTCSYCIEKAKQEAIDVILSDKAHYRTSLNYAINYCRAAKGMTGKDLEFQILYILSNISSWRHPQAKEVRATLRRKEA